MQTFLENVVSNLLKKTNGDLRNLTVVFPNKRAGLFFNQALGRLQPMPCWAPRFLTINNLFEQFSDTTLSDHIRLVCTLYQVYSKLAKTDETLDQFFAWGEMMLSDFNDIDTNLAPAEAIFTNLEDLENLTSFDYLTENQEKAIRQLFQNFNPQQKSELKQKFLTIWNLLLPTYQQFRQVLSDQGRAYDGMLKREVIDRLSDPAQSAEAWNRIDGTTYAFVGFNVLTQSEEKLLSLLKEHTTSYFYWDYTADPGGNDDEANRFVLQNIQRFGNEFHGTLAEAKQTHEITLVSSPTENAQAQYAADWVAENIQPGEQLNQTAIVLCNESLLQHLLHALPADHALNVTMGFPLQQTPIASLLNALLELQLHGFSSDRACRSTYVLPLLKHPYVDRLDSENTQAIIAEINTHHTLYPTTQSLGRSPILQQIFMRQTSTQQLIAYLAYITKQVGKTYQADEGKKNRDTNDQLYVEAVFNAYTLLNQLQSVADDHLLDVSPQTLSRLFRQLIAQKGIPFHGEPAVGLQVMGFLETRNLDFKNLLILSANEGNVPKNEHIASFIPYNLRDAYGMTTTEKRNALYAYHFFRLLRRAQHATLLYCDSTEGVSASEKSRFLGQLLTHTAPIEANVSLKAIAAPSQVPSADAIIVKKTPEVLEKLRERLSRPITPTALNTYIDCPLKFYFHYVAKLRRPDPATEDIESNTFGTIFHDAMQRIYTQILPSGKPIEAHQLEIDRKVVEAVVDTAFKINYFNLGENDKMPAYNGVQKITREALVRYVLNQLEYDAKLCPFTILATENDSKQLALNIDGTQLTIGGIVDRMDRVTVDGEQYLRIVDYKTSVSIQTTSSIEELFNSENDKRAYHIFQTFLYALVYSGSTKEPLVPALMYVKNSAKCKPFVMIDKTPVTNFQEQVKDEFAVRLDHLLHEMLSPEIPFKQATGIKSCKYCDFASLCQRFVEIGSWD